MRVRLHDDFDVSPDDLIVEARNTGGDSVSIFATKDRRPTDILLTLGPNGIVRAGNFSRDLGLPLEDDNTLALHLENPCRSDPRVAEVLKLLEPLVKYAECREQGYTEPTDAHTAMSANGGDAIVTFGELRALVRFYEEHHA